MQDNLEGGLVAEFMVAGGARFSHTRLLVVKQLEVALASCG